jgi:hypothetical protein
LNRYWDSITKEDLEFSVGSKQAVWEISTKDNLLGSNENQAGYGQYGAQGHAYGYPPPKGAYGY